MKVAFAWFAVAVGLASQVLLIGFLLDVAPVGINQGSASSVATALLFNLSLLGAFACPHSLMARPAFKRWWRALIPASLQRAVYILISGLLLGLLCLAWQPMPELLWAVENPLGRGLIYAGFFAGLGFLFWAIFSIDVLHFHGIHQALDRGGDPPFAMRGPYRWVRHPIQSGLILALWATPELSVGHAAFAGVLSVYSVVATLRLEERDLVRAIGGPYQRYREQVPALIPRFGRK